MNTLNDGTHHCVVCNANSNLQPHHISYEPEITEVTCRKCHVGIHRHGVGASVPRERSYVIKKAFKVGNSVAFTLPAYFVYKNKIKPGDDMEILFNGELHLKPVKTEDIKKYFDKKKEKEADKK